jgi:pilus assembly protein CpaE
MKTANVLMALENELLRQDARYLLGQLDTASSVQEQVPSDWSSVVKRVSETHPEILLVELAAIRADLDKALSEIRNSAPKAKIIAVHENDDPKIILAAMRAGANEFIHPPFEETLGPALERMACSIDADESPRANGKAIGFVSAKGGCGATTLACHIAADLKRQTGKDVLLADFDLTSGMIGFLMKIASSYSVLDAVKNLSRLDESLWKALVSEWKPGISVVPSPEAFSHEHAPTGEELRQVLRFMQSQHPWVVLDLGRSFNEIVSAVYEELDQLLIVSVLEVTALHGLKTIVQRLQDQGANLDKVQLVLNRTPKMMDITSEELEKILGRPLYAMLPNDYPSLYQSYSAGNLLPPNNRLAQQFAVLTARIADIQVKTQKKRFALFR